MPPCLTSNFTQKLSDFDSENNNDAELLESSIIKNDNQTVKYLLDKYKTRLTNLVEINSSSSLNKNSINLNDILPQSFSNILHLSIEYNAIDVIKTCIKFGIDPNKPINNILISNNCKYCNKNCDKNKIIISKSNSLTSVYDENLSTINYSSNSYLFQLPPIYLSISKCLHEHTEYLLKHRACPNIQDKYGNTPLHLAVAKQQPCYKCIYLLIKYHAKSNVLNWRHQTPDSILKQFIDGKNMKLTSSDTLNNWDFTLNSVYLNLFTDIFKEIDLARLNQTTINSNNSKIKYTKKQSNVNQKLKTKNSDSNSSLLFNKTAKSKNKSNDLDSKISSSKPLSLSLKNIAQSHYFSCNSLNIKCETNNYANNEFRITKVTNNKSGFRNKMNLLKSNRFKSIKKKSNKNDSFQIPSLIIDDSSISSTCNQNQNNSISVTNDSNNLSIPVFSSQKSNKKSKSLTNVRGIYANDLATISQNNSEATTPLMTPRNLKKLNDDKNNCKNENEKVVSSINSVNKLTTKSSDHKKTFKKYSLVIIGSNFFSNHNNNNNNLNKLQQQSNTSNSSSSKILNNNLINNSNNNNDNHFYSRQASLDKSNINNSTINVINDNNSSMFSSKISLFKRVIIYLINYFFIEIKFYLILFKSTQANNNNLTKPLQNQTSNSNHHHHIQSNLIDIKTGKANFLFIVLKKNI